MSVHFTFGIRSPLPKPVSAEPGLDDLLRDFPANVSREWVRIESSVELDPPQASPTFFDPDPDPSTGPLPTPWCRPVARRASSQLPHARAQKKAQGTSPALQTKKPRQTIEKKPVSRQPCPSKPVWTLTQMNRDACLRLNLLQQGGLKAAGQIHVDIGRRSVAIPVLDAEKVVRHVELER
jgi:hypothetical protein